MIIAELIKKAVNDYANKEFIIERELYRRKSYTYQQVYEKAISICAYFEKNKIKKGDKIIIYLPNSIDYVSLLWACALSGVIAVPIDFNNNTDFILKVDKQVKSKLIFCSIFKSPLFEKKKQIYQEEMEKVYSIIAENLKELAKKLDEEDIFEIVYTSGTIAEPKGVVLTNKNLVSNIKASEKIVDFNVKGYSFLSILPLSHLFEQNVGFFLPMSIGIRIIYNFSRKSSAILRTINEENIKAMVTVPLFLQMLKEKIENEAEKSGKKEKLEKSLARFSNSPNILKKIIFLGIRKKLGKLKYFICGGAELDFEVEKFWRNLGFTVLQGYGLTETSPVLTCNLIKENKIGSVGKPLEGIEIRLAEDKEILAKGNNVFNGYYKNPEKTRNTLKNGWIYTGDLGSFDENGFLYITGRKKNIIISSSGLNVYPEDIEKILNELLNIKDSVVIGLDGGKKLIAVLLSDEKLNTEAVLKEANLKLQSHQILSQIIQWHEEDFPRTTTKKIIRRKIEEQLNTILVRKYPKEKHLITDKIIKLISEALEINVEKINEKSNLQSLGMDSLKRIDLAVKIEEVFDIEEFNEDEITNKTSISSLRKIIEKSRSEKPETGINFLNSKIFSPLRVALQNISFFASSLLYTREVEGFENFKLIPKNQSVIFIVNHVSLLDSFSVFKTFPLKFRINTYPAGAKDFFFETSNPLMRLLGLVGRIGFNVFSFSRTSNIKQSLRDFAEIINRGGNIIIYPEGTRSKTGKLLPFKEGIGLLAWNMQVPIVPIKIEGLQDILPRDASFPKTGHIKVKVGKPMTFTKMNSPHQITEKLYKEMQKL